MAASGSAVWWPTELPLGSAMEGLDASASGGLGEADAVAGGGAEVGVVEEPVDGGAAEGFGHDLVEAIWNWHTFVPADWCCEQGCWSGG